MSTTLIETTLCLADNAVILGHRNSEWTGHGPILEQDIALSNIALDLIGQARNFYQYAAELVGNGATEDSLAYLRDASEFRNFLLVEQPNGDWGKSILRQFLFSAWQYPFFQTMEGDERLMAIAGKSLKEITYHLRWSSEWVIRLGQGTEESHRRMVNALQELWPYTAELNTPAFINRVEEIFSAAGLEIPSAMAMTEPGRHTPHLEKLLEEMQILQRTYPGVEW